MRLKSFPMSVVTTGRKLLIIGGGPEAELRLRHAVQFNWATVSFVAPHVPQNLRDIGAGDARFTYHERDVAEDDIKAVDLVLEDSADPVLAKKIAGWCEKHGALLNATDKPELCDLFYTSFLVREPLTVAISSGGDAPRSRPCSGAGWNKKSGRAGRRRPGCSRKLANACRVDRPAWIC